MRLSLLVALSFLLLALTLPTVSPSLITRRRVLLQQVDADVDVNVDTNSDIDNDGGVTTTTTTTSAPDVTATTTTAPATDAGTTTAPTGTDTNTDTDSNTDSSGGVTTTSAPATDATTAPTAATGSNPTQPSETDSDSDNGGAVATSAPTTAGTTEAPSEAPSEAPATTEAPSEAPAATEAPSEAPSSAPAATEAPATTQAPAATSAPSNGTNVPSDAPVTPIGGAGTEAPEGTSAPTGGAGTSAPSGGAGTSAPTPQASAFPGPNSNPDVCPQFEFTYATAGNRITFTPAAGTQGIQFVDVHVTAGAQFLNYRCNEEAGVYSYDLPNTVYGSITYWFTYVAPVDDVLRGCDTLVYSADVPRAEGAPEIPGRGGAAPQAGDQGTVCYQAIVGSLTGSYADINAAFDTWAQRAYDQLGLTGPRDMSINWAQVPDRNSFENGCNGPYQTVADIFVHIDTNQASNDDYVTLADKLEAYVAANPWNATGTAISCSARSVTDFIPICGINAGLPTPNAACPLATFDYIVGDSNGSLAINVDNVQANATLDYIDVHITHGDAQFNYRMVGSESNDGSYSYPLPLSYLNLESSRSIDYYFTYAVNGVQCDSETYVYTVALQPTGAPSTAAPSTAAPTTAAPSTAAPTTAAPSTAAPTTAAPSTAAPTTAAPSTAAPTTAAPSTAAPTTSAPTVVIIPTEAPTTAAPSTAAPTTASPIEECELIQWCVGDVCTPRYPTALLPAVGTSWSCTNRVCTAVTA